jgi:hypothetical protein
LSRGEIIGIVRGIYRPLEPPNSTGIEAMLALNIEP